LVKSTDTTVEDNVVERTGHGGIVFEAELYWLEGPFNSRALIRRNHLADIGGGALDSLGISLTLAAIQVGNSFGQRMFPRMLTLGTQNTEIEITDNQVLRPVAFPIWVRNVDRAVVRGNRITAPFAGGALPGFIDMSRLLSPRAVASDRDRELLREPYYGVLLQNVSAATIGPNPVFGAPVYYKAELGTVTLQATP
jgi:hypothetical protein